MGNSRAMNFDDLHAEILRLKRRAVRKVKKETRRIRTRNALRRWKRSAKTMLKK